MNPDRRKNPAIEELPARKRLRAKTEFPRNNGAK
jgi:hypothetical protein